MKAVQRYGWRWVLSVLVGLVGMLGWAGRTIAAPPFNASPDLLKQPPQEIVVALGTAENDLQFVPDRLEFSAGKRYKLTLTNPSNSKHYFTAKDFADGIWTQKVEAGGVEIKGAVHELELKPGAKAEWVFVALKSGDYPLRCTIPGHTEAGMVGQIGIHVS
ncbi:MAG: cupredoxin domain-containing protein [Leptolyngbyaceae cyanobacterium bins.59]|nr:cupredoxin domain-containing protein [Leptolyngbyaceae cyanobacterium bins.59]